MIVKDGFIWRSYMQFAANESIVDSQFWPEFQNGGDAVGGNAAYTQEELVFSSLNALFMYERYPKWSGPDGGYPIAVVMRLD